MEITLPALIRLFAATKQTEGRTLKTVSWYTNMLLRFDKFLGGDAKLPDVSIHEARAFVAHLQAMRNRYENHPFRPKATGGLSPSTIHGYVRALKAFSSWLAAEEFTPKDIFARLKRPITPKPVIQILTEDELAALLSTINPKCLLGARLYTMVLLLLDTGMSAGELCGIKLDDVHLDEGYVKVFGKGQKERIAPFGDTTKRALLRWLMTWREELANGTDALFLSNNGQPLSYGALSKAIKRLGNRSGIPRLHPHLFRHTFAVSYLMNGGDVMTLRLILGHATLDVTLMYMHLAEAHVKLQHHKFSPVDRLGIGRRRRNRR